MKVVALVTFPGWPDVPGCSGFPAFFLSPFSCPFCLSFEHFV